MKRVTALAIIALAGVLSPSLCFASGCRVSVSVDPTEVESNPDKWARYVSSHIQEQSLDRLTFVLKNDATETVRLIGAVGIQERLRRLKSDPSCYATASYVIDQSAVPLWGGDVQVPASGRWDAITAATVAGSLHEIGAKR